MARETHPLSDLSFFRFPDLTPDVVRNIVLLVLLLALTVLLTAVVQRHAQRWFSRRAGRSLQSRFYDDLRLDERARTALQHLMALSGVADEAALVRDAPAYERAVAALVEAAETDADTLAGLAQLRRALHLNAMNAELELVSTRQLLADMPVRVVAHIGTELLDVYGALLRVDEGRLLLTLPEQEELAPLLERHAEVRLIYWREREGEAVFRLRLEVERQGALVLIGAAHAFRDRTAAHRDDFRLTLDAPATYQRVDSGRPGRRAAKADAASSATPSEAPTGAPTGREQGRLLDLSYGGASLVVETPQPPPVHALLHLAFELHGRPMHLMLEVLSHGTHGAGRHVARGRFRGLGDDVRARLHTLLHREQLKRLRDKELLHVRPGA